MKIFKSIFFWISIGIITLSIGFYFTAPLMGFENQTQNIFISILVAVVGLFLSLFVKMKKHFSALQKKKIKSNAAEWELSWQKELAKETRDILKKISEVFKKTSISIENTKFILVLGHKASGKSSLIRKSGHHLRYAFPSIQDSQKRGKIFFNWSISNNAVYIEVPSEYLAVGDSPSQELLFFLELLKDELKKKAIDGVLIAENIEVLTSSLDAKNRADTLRKSVEGIMAQLQLEVPVYLALTHIDVMDGAKLYCDGHDSNFLTNCFGVSLNYVESENPRSAFELRFDTLLNDLYDNQLFSMYTQQVKGIQPVQIYSFARVLSENKNSFADYVENLCKKGLTKENSYFRGLYLTGVDINDSDTSRGVVPVINSSSEEVLQQDTDSVQNAGVVSDIYSVQETTGSKTISYFASALLHFIEKEKDLVRFPKYRQSSMSRMSAFVSILLVICALGIASYGVYGYTFGKILLSSWSTSVDNAKRMKWNSPQSIIREFPKYNELRTTINSIEENRSLKIAPGFYRDAQVLPKAEKKHILLSHSLTRNCIKQLEKDIKNRLDEGVNDKLRSKVYGDFKLYVSLTNVGKEHYKKMNVDSITTGLTRLWYSFLNLTPYTASEQIKQNLPLNARLYAQYLLEDKVEDVNKLYVANSALIKTARLALAGDSEIEAIYQSMVAEGNKSPSLKMVDLGISENSFLVNTSEIPAAFTKAVFDSIIKTYFSRTNSAQGDWVLGKDKEKSMVDKALEKKVMNKYFRDFAYTWKQFIENIKVERHADLQKLSGQLTDLASVSQGEMLFGLRAFIENVSRNTDLRADYSGVKNIANKVSSPNKKLNNKMKILRRYQDDVPESMMSPEERLANKFSGFSMLTNEIKEKKFDSYFDDLVQVSKFLIETSGTHDQAIEFLQKLFKGDRKNPINHAYATAQEYIDQVPANQQKLLNNILLLLTKEIVQTVVQFASQGLEAEYEKQVVMNYQSYLQDAFPFNKDAIDKQVSLDDMKFFFGGKSGAFTSFLNKVHPFIELRTDECVLTSWKGITMPFDSKALLSIHKAHKLSLALFHPNVDKFRQYQLKFMFNELQRAELTIGFGEDKYEVKRGSGQKIFALKWPSASMRESSFNVVSVDDTFNRLYKGEWGLLHFVNEFGETKNQNSINIYWPIKAKSYYINVNGELTVDRKFNPINVKSFFTLPISESLLLQNIEAEVTDLREGDGRHI